MDKRPKRNRYEDNPYFLHSDKENNLYLVYFLNDAGKNIVDISKELFENLDEIEKNEARIIQYDKRYLEKSHQTDINLYKRAVKKPWDVDETVIKKNEYIKLHKAIDTLSPIHKRRILLYFKHDLSMSQIAEIEGCSKMAIKYSIDVALKHLRKFFEEN